MADELHHTGNMDDLVAGLYQKDEEEEGLEFEKLQTPDAAGNDFRFDVGGTEHYDTEKKVRGSRLESERRAKEAGKPQEPEKRETSTANTSTSSDGATGTGKTSTSENQSATLSAATTGWTTTRSSNSISSTATTNVASTGKQSTSTSVASSSTATSRVTPTSTTASTNKRQDGAESSLRDSNKGSNRTARGATTSLATSNQSTTKTDSSSKVSVASNGTKLSSRLSTQTKGVSIDAAAMTTTTSVTAVATEKGQVNKGHGSDVSSAKTSQSTTVTEGGDSDTHGNSATLSQHEQYTGANKGGRSADENTERSISGSSVSGGHSATQSTASAPSTAVLPENTHSNSGSSKTADQTQTSEYKTPTTTSEVQDTLPEEGGGAQNSTSFEGAPQAESRDGNSTTCASKGMYSTTPEITHVGVTNDRGNTGDPAVQYVRNFVVDAGSAKEGNDELVTDDALAENTGIAPIGWEDTKEGGNDEDNQGDIENPREEYFLGTAEAPRDQGRRRSSIVDDENVAQVWRELQYKHYKDWFEEFASSEDEDDDSLEMNNFVRKELPVTDFEYQLYDPSHYYLDYTPLITLQPRNIDTALRVKRDARDISLMILVTVSHEDGDLLQKTLTGIANNLASLQKKVDILWDEVAVCIMVDGRQMMNESLRHYAETQLKVFDSSMIELYSNDQPTQVHIFERSVEIPRYLQQGDYFEPLQVMFAVKEYNGGRLNSHLWFFSGFCQQLRPQYTLLMDCGVEPLHCSIAYLMERLEEELTVGSVSGEISTRDLSLWNPVHAAQHFEQKLHSVLTFTSDSITNYMVSPTSGFVAYKYKAIEGTVLGKYLVAEERTPSELGPQKSNMFMADQRVLAHELALHPTQRYKIVFESRARALQTMPSSLLGLLHFRRPHYNGATMINWEFVQHFASATFGKRDTVNPFLLILSVIQYVHKTISFLLEWFAIGIMFLIAFIVASVSLEETNGGSANSAFALTVGYTFLTVVQVMIGLGGNPEDFRVVYWLISFAFGFIMLFLAALAAFLAAMQDFNFVVFIIGIGSIGLVLLATFFQGKLLNLLKATWQFVFMVPFFVNMVPIFSFCNLHDTSDSQSIVHRARRAARLQRGSIFGQPESSANKHGSNSGSKKNTNNRKNSVKVAPEGNENAEKTSNGSHQNITVAHQEPEHTEGVHYDTNGNAVTGNNPLDSEENEHADASIMSLRHYRRRRSSVLGESPEDVRAPPPEKYATSVGKILKACREDDNWRAQSVIVEALSNEATRVRSLELQTQEEHQKVKNFFSAFRTKALSWWLLTNWFLITGILWSGATAGFAMGIAILLGSTIVGRVLGSFMYSIGQAWRHSFKGIRRHCGRCCVGCCLKCCLCCSCWKKCCVASCRNCYTKAKLVHNAREANKLHDVSAAQCLKDLENSTLAPNRLRRIQRRHERQRQAKKPATLTNHQTLGTGSPGQGHFPFSQNYESKEGPASENRSQSPQGSEVSTRVENGGESETGSVSSRREKKKKKRRKHRHKRSSTTGIPTNKRGSITGQGGGEKPPPTPYVGHSPSSTQTGGIATGRSREGPRRPSYLLQGDPVSGMFGSPHSLDSPEMSNTGHFSSPLQGHHRSPRDGNSRRRARGSSATPHPSHARRGSV
eukprot:gb/GECG01003700.1/.p1 GENE.gb/GECG01003700.1/~~gb/GECG01003700.1/.p1  ORF type:complete len:1630 (+),score=224.77 gb/GECG01003700.1/:1-4890(+)